MMKDMVMMGRRGWGIRKRMRVVMGGYDRHFKRKFGLDLGRNEYAAHVGQVIHVGVVVEELHLLIGIFALERGSLQLLRAPPAGRQRWMNDICYTPHAIAIT
eukprot:5588261-Pyramimonas_sp.AAC.1